MRTDQNDDFDLNDDYPPLDDNAPDNPRPFPDPTLRNCVRMSQNVRVGANLIVLNEVLVENGHFTTFSRAGGFDDDNDAENIEDFPRQNENQETLIAYLIFEFLSLAIHGRVYIGKVLRRSRPDDDWHMTTELCAIKAMRWTSIRDGRHTLENARDEIAAMQHVKEFLDDAVQDDIATMQHVHEFLDGTTHPDDPRDEIAAMEYIQDFFDGDGVNDQPVAASDAMRDKNIIMPLNFLYDDTNIYVITPLCDGEELFDRLRVDQPNFTEEESRNLLTHILHGLELLHRARLCHRDIRCENIMMHQGRPVIIDMGTCLKIPYVNDDMDGAPTDYRYGLAQRCLINRQPRAGKLGYMAPEIYSEEPFDGHAVDMWSVGVCLYKMLTNTDPWNTAASHDRDFRHFSGGYLIRILNYRGSGLSPDAKDLLQRMLFLDPTDRLSLQQVRNHPWMNPTNP